MPTLPPRHPCRSALRIAAAACLLAAFVIHGFSALLTELLGPVHFHSDAVTSLQVMAGWQDPRRTQHLTDGATRVHSHDLLGRHRHDVSQSDMTVLGDDRQDGPSGGSAAGSAIVYALVACEPLSATLAPPTDSSSRWGRPSVERIESCDPHRLDRPPKI
jgi:hypothetical protein